MKNAARWIPVWAGLGLGLAGLVLFNSVQNYLLVSRRVILDHSRRDLSARAVALETAAFKTGAALEDIADDLWRRAGGRLAWVQVIGEQDEILASAGSPRQPSFTARDLRSRLRRREAAFKTIDTPEGALLVEAFPLRLPPVKQTASVRLTAHDPRPRLALLELAGPLDGSSNVLWPLRRNLLINSSAALALLLCIGVMSLRVRGYLAGRELAHQVEVAERVQRDLLPQAHGERGGFDLAADYTPAAYIGGDFYDAFTAQGKAAFVLGDVCGKGVPAALLMGVIHGAVRASSWAGSAEAHQTATARINRLLCERSATERFSSLFWAYFDQASLRYINAGHFAPLVVRNGHVTRLDAGGPLLGLLPGARYEQGAVAFQPGDLLVLFSDGVIEARNEAGEEFGDERLVRAVLAHQEGTAGEIRDRLLAEVRAFSGRGIPEDDRTLVVVRQTATATMRPTLVGEAA